MANTKRAFAPDGESPVLPHDVDMEQALLGALLVDNYWFERVGLDLKAEHFYDGMHQQLCDCMLSLHAKGHVVSPLTVKALMEGNPAFEEVGGYPYLVSLARSVSALPNVPDYCKILADLALRRDLVRIGNTISDSAYAHTQEMGNAAQIASRAADALFNAARSGEVKRPQLMSVVAAEALAIHERRLAGEKFPVVKSGITKLDDEIGGFRGKFLTTIAGRSGMGKSALMGGIALCAAMAGVPVLIFSLEMAKEQWTERSLCDLDFFTNAANPLRYQKFTNGRATNEELDRALAASMKLGGLPIEIIDSDQLTIEDITALARAYVTAHGRLGLIILDYLQIVVPTVMGREVSREQQVTHIARGTKSMAKQTGWHVIAGCQLINKGQKADDDDKRPTAADIRETGAIEIESDLILAPWRKAFFLEQKRQQAMQTPARKEAWLADYARDKNKFELLGLKNRHGRRFDLELWCDMGSSAIRDKEPLSAARAKANEDAQGLLLE